MKKGLGIFCIVILPFLIQVSLGFCQEKGEEQGKNPQLDIVLVLDNSGSMKKNDPEFLTREVVTNFVNGLGENSRLGMVIFDQEARLAEPLKEVVSPEAKAEFLKGLGKVNYKGQYTNSPAGIERAIYELKTNAREDAQKVIIFLTDGIVDTGDKDKDLEKEKWLKEDLAQESKQEGIRIFGVAFTDKADFRLIQSLAHKTDGEYFRAYKAEDIQEVFQNIHAVINKPPEEPEVAITQAKEETPGVATEEKVTPAPPATQPTIEKKVAAETEKAPESVKKEPPQPPPVIEKKNISLPLIIAGLIVLAGILILVFVFKGKSKPVEDEIRPVAAAPADEPPKPVAQLIDLGKVVSERPMELKKKNITIGRGQDNVIAIPKETVSGFHATIEFKNGYFYLEDQRSANGTSLNDRKIAANKPIRLKSGDHIKFDIYEFTFFIPGQAPIGKTVLAGGQAVQQSEGTVLRTSKPEEGPSEALQEKQPGDSKPKSPPSEQDAKKPEQKTEPEVEPPEQDPQTRLKSSMCPTHASMKATELCPVCKNAFCKRCMTKKEGKAVCVNCAAEL